MRLHQLFSSLLIRRFGGIVLVFSAFSVMYAQSPTAPTASEERAKIDHIWQKASTAISSWAWAARFHRTLTLIASI
jgi:hypothetical protein